MYCKMCVANGFHYLFSPHTAASPSLNSNHKLSSAQSHQRTIDQVSYTGLCMVLICCVGQENRRISPVNSLEWLVDTPIGKSMKAFSALFVYSFLTILLKNLHYTRHHHSKSIYQRCPGSSKSRYVGIWFVVSNVTVVWVASRETPLENLYGVLKVTNKGILVLLDKTNTTIWSSNTSSTGGNKIYYPTAQLLDSGNLVVKDGNISDPKTLLWQSFDCPRDTLLPKMKLGWDLVSGLDRYLTSWKSAEDPAQGEISGGFDRRGLPQLVAMEGERIKDRSGSWNGLYFTGRPWLKPNPLFKYEVVMNEKEIYFEYEPLNNSILLRYVLNPLGIGDGFKWMDSTQSWELIGPVGVFEGLHLGCNDGDGFLNFKDVKLPDTSSSWFDRNMSLKECEELCLKNCSCRAYANLDIRNGESGCLLWFADLVDIVVLQIGGQDLYIRGAASLLNHIEKKRHLPVIIIVCSAILLMVMLVVGLVSYVRRMKLRNEEMNIRCQNDYNNEGKKEDMELPIFDLTVISNATDNFTSSNMLGEGGFGFVYKVSNSLTS
ncbi:hypothetical protein SO802_000289 [Lithocarpus litseifolius]|uniref:Uncharacterized protein n=1 Tax=Lithocarpus litseifolius TaxID=425828 RepID=A0AAW2DV67_9ROSI